MGIGAAFATGLVKGFTQNIQQEKARRLAENEKVDALEQLVFAASLDPNKKVSQGAKDLLKSARKQLDERPNIDLFGRATDGIDLDFAKLQSSLNDTTDFNYKITGSSPDSFIGFSRGKGEGTYADAFAHLSEYQLMLLDPKIAKKIRNDPVLAQNLQNELAAQQQRIIAADLKQYLNADPKNKPSSFRHQNIFGVNKNSGFRGLEIHNQIMNALNIPVTSIAEINANASSQLSSAQTGQATQLPGHKVAGYLIVPEMESGDVVGYSVGTVNLKEGQMPIYEGIAKRLNVPVVGSPQGGMGLFSYWVGEDANGMAIPANEQYFSFLGMGPPQKMQALSASMQLANYPGIEALDPELALSRLGYNQTGDAEVLAFSAKLNATAAGTFEQKVMAIAPYMTFDKDENELQIPFFNYQDAGNTRQMYILKKRFGDLANTTVATSFDALKQQLGKKETALVALKELQIARASIDEPEVYARFKKALNVAFIGQGSVADAIAKDLLGLGVMKEQTDGLTDDFLNSLDQGIKSKGSTALAELEAMRISLAFQLARAADPSGRLSNQDVQQQLDRLGADFSTKEQAVAKIQVVIRELERDINKMKVFVAYGDGNAVLKPNEAKIIDAAIAVDYIENRAGALRQKAGLAGGASTINPDDYTILGDRVVDANEFTTVTDQATIDAIKKAKGLQP